MTSVKETKSDMVRSQYSMGLFDFSRFHELLKMADEMGYNVNIGMPGLEKNIPAYFSILEQIHINFFVLIPEADVKKLDDRFDSMRKKIRDKDISYTLISELKAMHRDLNMIKQKSGLGLIMTRLLSENERMKNIFGV